jgi:hypothetical protein
MTAAAKPSRIVIAGGPRTGKTSRAEQLAAELGVPVRHTDDLISTHAWSAASDEVATWLEQPGPWIVEGVAAVRGLRKWMQRHAWGPPADLVYWGAEPVVLRSRQQQTMANGCGTIWREILPLLLSRNVQVLDLPRTPPADARPA